MSFRFMRRDNTIRTIRNIVFYPAFLFIPKAILSGVGKELNSIKNFSIMRRLYPSYRADTRQGVSVEYLRSPVTA